MRVLALIALMVALGACAAPKSPLPPTAQPATPKPEGDVVRLEAAAPSEDDRASVGRRYLDFEAPRLSGGQFRLSDSIGKRVVLLQFWGIRCSPCLAEMTFLAELQRSAPQGLEIVAVNTDALPAERLREAMAARSLNPPFSIVCDQDSSASKRYTHWLIPVLVLIDRKGVVRALHTGYGSHLDASLAKEVGTVLGEGG